MLRGLLKSLLATSPLMSVLLLMTVHFTQADETVSFGTPAKKDQLNFIQDKLVQFIQPKPIVDTITEEEKYGNTVEHTFGKKVVKAVEGLSHIINAAFSFPVETVKKASRTATEALNNIGGKLVGLQR